MADTITLPGAGPVKKGYVYGGLAVLAAILAVAYFRHSKTSAAATTGSQDPNAIDPATGLTYAEEAAGVTSAPADTSGIIGYDSAGNPIYSSSAGTGPIATSFATNNQWSQAAENYLVNTAGSDPGTVAAALGDYLAGTPLTDAQITVVNAAIAFEGLPPQQGLNGYPPSYRTKPAGGGGGGGGPLPAPTGLHLISVTKSEIHVGWTAVKGTASYQIQVTPKDKTGHAVGNRTNYVAWPLKPRTRYTIHVSSQAGGPSAAISATTK